MALLFNGLTANPSGQGRCIILGMFPGAGRYVRSSRARAFRRISARRKQLQMFIPARCRHCEQCSWSSGPGIRTHLFLASTPRVVRRRDQQREWSDERLLLD